MARKKGSTTKNSNKKKEPKYYELHEDSIQKFYDVFNTKSFPTNIGFEFVGCDQKQLIKISRISEQYKFILNKDILVSINDEYMSLFDDESVKILIEQEIDKISIHLESGKIKLVKTDLNTFSSLVSKYGIEKVSKANNVEELYTEQKADAQTDDVFNI